MNTKMKGLLKGLRYISHIFENEKEEEMEIGLPTDVKHVAHIGWDGPSVSSPSWMNEFKSSPGQQSISAPLNAYGNISEDPSVPWASEDSRRQGSAKAGEGSPARDLPKIPKSSRRHTSSSSVDSPTKSKSDKSSKHSVRRSSKSSQSPGMSSKQPPDGQGDDSPRGSKLPAIPKKSRRKKSKESIGEGSSRSSTRSLPEQPPSSYDSGFSDPGYNQSSSLGAF